MEQNPDSPAVETATAASDLEADLNPLPQPENALALSAGPAAPGQALVPRAGAEPPAELDAHGFDPGAYRWIPVLRKPRKDGWTAQRQVDYIAKLADYGCVEQAAREVGMAVNSCYRLRRESPAFAAAWDAALAHASRRLVDLPFDRAIHGSDEPVFNREGHRVGRRMRHNDRLLMFLLRAYMPERFRHAHKGVRTPDEPPPPASPPIEEVLRRLEPVAPAEPHKLMSAEDLDVELRCAEIGDGVLPRWYRGRGDAEPRVDYSLGEEFERALAAAKREAAGLPPLEDAPAGEDDEEDYDDEG